MDKSLLQAIQQLKEGKEEGFNKVYSETYNHVYFRAKSYMKDEEDTLDLVQIVYVEAYKNIVSLQEPEALYGWLDGITYRQGMKQYRKKRDVLLTEEGEGVFETLETEDISSMPELTADQKETSRIIRELIEELPVLQKIAMIAYYFDNMSVGQIAEIQECSEGTVKSRLNYGRKYLKDRIEEKEKKEGYRLHVFTLPTLYFAIKTMSEETTMTVYAAQGVYNASCAATGLTAGAIGAQGISAGAAIGASQTVVAEGVKASAIGAGAKVAGGVAVEVGKAAGIGAKFASLSMGAKAIVVASTLAVGTATVGGVAHVATNQPVIESENHVGEFSSADVSSYISLHKLSPEEEFLEAVLYPTRTGEYEYTFYAADLQKHFVKEERIGCNGFTSMPQEMYISSITFINAVTGETGYLTYGENDSVLRVNFVGDPSANIVVTVATRGMEQEAENLVEETATEETTSEETITINLSETEKMQITDAIAYFGCMVFEPEITEYVSTARSYIKTMQNGDGVNALPCGWTSDVVTEETVKAFYEDGFGITISDGYTYDDYGVTCNSELTWDVSLDYFKYDNLEVVANEDGTYALTGAFIWGAEGEEDLYSFEATAVASGNPNVFGGLKLTSYVVNE